MNRLLCAGLSLALLAAAPPAPDVDPEPAPPLPDAATVAAVRDLGGGYVLLFPDGWGHMDWVPTRDAGRQRGLPGFVFRRARGDNVLIDLPPIRVPFGLLLTDCSVTEAALKHLADRSRLRHLRLNNTRLSEDGLRRLGDLAGLESLELIDAGITDASLRYLTRLKRLRHLAVAEDRRGIREDGFAHLARMTRLETLRLDASRLTDIGLGRLAKLTNLRHLALYSGAMGDTALRHLAGLSRLRTLELLNCRRLTDEGLRHLAGLKGLRRLRLIGTPVTDAGVARLRKALPELDVDH